MSVCDKHLKLLLIAIEALSEIKHSEGKVCPDFAECRHEACRSSYASWAIADKALRNIVE